MSPDRGQERGGCSAQMDIDNKSKVTSRRGSGDGDGLDVASMPDYFRSRSNTYDSLGTLHTTAMDARQSKQSSASVKSLSSTENSRRDSAISASSQQRRRPKTSRSTSKQSLQSAPADSFTKSSTGSSGRQRPHRFASTGAYVRPQANIEEALALHARSCRIFATVSRPTTSHASSTHGQLLHPALHRSLSSADALPSVPFEYRHQVASNAVETVSHGFNKPDETEDIHENQMTATITHWRSDEAHRKEYAAIDRSHRGFRGLLMKVLPKWATKEQSKFYDEKEGSDAGSVRRIRLDLPDEKDYRRKW